MIDKRYGVIVFAGEEHLCQRYVGQQEQELQWRYLVRPFPRRNENGRSA